MAPYAAVSSAPTRQEVLSLLRALLRTARRFPDYNIREYAKRRTLDGFRHNNSLSDASSLSDAFSDGVSQLEVAQRQSTVFSLFQPKFKSIIESDNQLMKKENPIEVDAAN